MASARASEHGLGRFKFRLEFCSSFYVQVVYLAMPLVVGRARESAPGAEAHKLYVVRSCSDSAFILDKYACQCCAKSKCFRMHLAPSESQLECASATSFDVLLVASHSGDSCFRCVIQFLFTGLSQGP
jgi:hypothetical protein